MQLSTTAHRSMIFKRLCALTLGVTLVAILAYHSTDSSNAATNISQSYKTTDDLSMGSIVSLTADTIDQVEAGNISNNKSLLGVVIDSSDSQLSIIGGIEEVQVATDGVSQVLVSNINGDIVKGDHITTSMLNGVGMKASSNVRIVGIAQGDLNGSTGKDYTYKDASGVEQTVVLGTIPILINTSYYFKEPDKTVIPSALQNIANTIAGKQVNPIPIILSGIIFIIMIIVVVSIVYSMIKSSIISIGRNPMSQSAVYRDLIQLSALVLIILAVGIIAIYLLLTRI
jgi:hypothetical protein